MDFGTDTNGLRLMNTKSGTQSSKYVNTHHCLKTQKGVEPVAKSENQGRRKVAQSAEPKLAHNREKSERERESERAREREREHRSFSLHYDR